MKMNLNKVLHSAKTFTKKHSPEILTGIGLAGMASSVIMAVKATPKVLLIIEEEEERIYQEKLPLVGEDTALELSELSTVDKVKLGWKPYIPAIVTGLMGAGCILGASAVNTKRNAALATAYTLSESMLKEYQAGMVDVIGEDKAKEITDTVQKKLFKEDNKEYAEVKEHTNTEVLVSENKCLCYDVCSGRYFLSSMNDLQKAENEINRRMRNNMYASLNEFYYEIGLRSTSMGDVLGWNMDDGDLNLSLGTQIADDGTPCLVVDYTIAPRYDYEKLL